MVADGDQDPLITRLVDRLPHEAGLLVASRRPVWRLRGGDIHLSQAPVRFGQCLERIGR